MVWNWELPDWPNFRWDHEQLVQSEQSFIENAGVMIGASKHVSTHDRQAITVELLSVDAMNTSEKVNEKRRDII